MNKYITTIFILGFFGLLYSLSLKAFTDSEVFHQKYRALSSGQSKEFFELRDSMLTPKYYIQDVAITLMSISILLFLFLKKGNGYIKSPKNKFLFILMSFLLPLITVWGFMYDLGQGMFRNEFPHWADSLGIPLAGVPIQFIILLIWSTLHLFFLRKLKPSPVVLTLSNLKK